ncbi:MAG: UvrD-helicase domain-containing protein [Lachnospiraceae bacterium]|nr:UvrD-helicase domain-containing protein [Lachnospiraceae bacterium]
MNLEQELNREQLEAVLHVQGPLLILAGAGSGKTRVLTYRIAHLLELGVNPWQILALTFTNKAAGEMRQRVDQMAGPDAQRIWVSTFHSTCVRILRRFSERLGFESHFTIYDTDDQRSLMKEILKLHEIDPQLMNEKTVLSYISSAKDRMIGPARFLEEAAGDYRRTKAGECYEDYQRRLRANNSMDFDDLILYTIRLFQENEDVLEHYQQRFRYIMVDEYQDTNQAQFELVRLLAHYVNEDGEIEHNLCVVGDDDQSIYRFRGADIHNILSFEARYPGCRTIRLEENYRSTQTILDAANEVIANNKERKKKRLWTKNPKGEAISLIQYENEYEEASGVVAKIAELVKEGAHYRDCAILYRTNAQSRVFEEKFNIRAIPYHIVNGHNFYERKEIKDLLAYLAVLDNPADDLAVRRIINVPKRGIGLTTIDRIQGFAVNNDMSFYEALQHAEYIPDVGRSRAKLDGFTALMEGFREKMAGEDYSLLDLMNDVLEKTGYLDELKAEGTEESKGRIENIDELLNIIGHYIENVPEDEEATLSGLLEQIKINGEGGSAADGEKEVRDPDDRVLLMTLHSAKGLEFPYVFLCGMEDGIFPGYGTILSDDESDMEEERRLAYVGITRAKKMLYMSCAKLRMMRGETTMNKPSSFIREIPRHLIHQGGTGPRKYESGQKAFRRDSGKLGSGNGGIFGSNPYISKGVGAYQNRGTMFDKPAKPSAETIDYAAGDRVSHIKFGEGTVLDLVKKGADAEVTVEFDKAGRKKMLASFAKLRKI